MFIHELVCVENHMKIDTLFFLLIRNNKIYKCVPAPN